MSSAVLVFCMSGLAFAMTLSARRLVAYLADNLPPPPHVPTFREGLAIARSGLTIACWFNAVCMYLSFPLTLIT